jgi:hypothetical protein
MEPSKPRTGPGAGARIWDPPQVSIPLCPVPAILLQNGKIIQGGGCSQVYKVRGPSIPTQPGSGASQLGLATHLVIIEGEEMEMAIRSRPWSSGEGRTSRCYTKTGSTGRMPLGLYLERLPHALADGFATKWQVRVAGPYSTMLNPWSTQVTASVATQPLRCLPLWATWSPPAPGPVRMGFRFSWSLRVAGASFLQKPAAALTLNPSLPPHPHLGLLSCE